MQSWLIVIWIWSVVILFLLRWRLVWFRHFVSSCAFVFLVGFCFQVCHQPISSFHPLCPVQVFLVVSSVSLCLVPSCYFVFLSCYFFFLMFVSILSPCFVCHSGVFCCYFKFFFFFLGLCVMFDSLSFSCFPAFFGGCGGRVHNHHALMTDDTKSYCLYKCFTLLFTLEQIQRNQTIAWFDMAHFTRTRMTRKWMNTCLHYEVFPPLWSAVEEPDLVDSDRGVSQRNPSTENVLYWSP